VFIPRAHLVFVTRYRMFVARHPSCMEQIMRDVRADFGTGLAEFNGEPERVHLLANLAPTLAISRLGQKPHQRVFP
jgi:putative transposase